MKPPSTELSLERCLEWYRRRGGRGVLALLARVDSTNRLARRVARPYLAEDRPPPVLVLVAREQTAGRGRRGRSWISPAGQGIYTSLLLAMDGLGAPDTLPLRVPVALCDALTEAGVDCGIKWPNDLVIGGRKLGGVLIEALAGGRAAIVGWGVNGSQRVSELPTAEATSLRLALGRAPDLSRLAVDLALAVLDRLARSEPMAGLLEAYRARSVHRRGEAMTCRLGEEEVRGRFAGFDERGRLRLAVGDGERAIDSGDLLRGEPGDVVASAQERPER